MKVSIDTDMSQSTSVLKTCAACTCTPFDTPLDVELVPSETGGGKDLTDSPVTICFWDEPGMHRVASNLSYAMFVVCACSRRRGCDRVVQRRRKERIELLDSCTSLQSSPSLDMSEGSRPKAQLDYAAMVGSSGDLGGRGEEREERRGEGGGNGGKRKE